MLYLNSHITNLAVIAGDVFLAYSKRLYSNIITSFSHCFVLTLLLFIQ